MSTIREVIISKKPNLSKSSIDTYCSNIRAVSKKIDIPLNSVKDIIKNHKVIFEAVKDLKTNTRKTRLASLVVVLDDKDKNSKKTDKILSMFREQMKEDLKEIRNKDTKQEMSQSQKDAFVPWNQVQNLYKIVKTEATPLFRLKNWTYSQFKKVLDYIILTLYTQMPPRRSLDYTAFKIKEVDETKDNFMKYSKGKYTMVFNKYKNSKKLGSQEVEIPKSVGALLKKFCKKSPYDYLVVNSLGKSVKQNYINNTLNRLFGKKIGSSMLRHIYTTEKFGNVDLEDLKQTTEDMGNSEPLRTLKYVSKEHSTD